jgi:hypothetical protein
MDEAQDELPRESAELREARKEVALCAQKVAKVGPHAARMAILREDPAGVELTLGWVNELREATGALREALEDVRDLQCAASLRAREADGKS